MQVAITAQVYDRDEDGPTINFNGTVYIRRLFLWPTYKVELELRDEAVEAVEDACPGRFKHKRVHLFRARRLWW